MATRLLFALLFTGCLPQIAAAQTFVLSWATNGRPTEVAVDNQGNVYVSNFEGTIQKFDPSGTELLQWGNSGFDDGEFLAPSDMAVSPDGKVHEADDDNDRIQRFLPDGNFDGKWGNTGTGDENFMAVTAIAIDGSGNVYVVDIALARVSKYSATGQYLLNWGTPGTGVGELSTPGEVCVDPQDLVHVTEETPARVQSFDTGGNPVGMLTEDLGTPIDIAFSIGGESYLADFFGRSIRLFSAPTPVKVTAWGEIKARHVRW